MRLLAGSTTQKKTEKIRKRFSLRAFIRLSRRFGITNKSTAAAAAASGEYCK